MAKATWDELVRAVIKAECGTGWSITEQSGNAKVTRIYRDEGDKRVTRSKQLGIEWKASNSSKIQNAVVRLHKLIFERNITLEEAVRLDAAACSSDNPEAPETASEGWDVIAGEFIEIKKEGRRANTLKDLKLRLKRTVKALEHKPMPIDGKSLLKKYAKLYFEKMKSGESGRRRNLNDVCAFLKFAVQEKGKPTRYLPPQKSFIDELVGESQTTQKAKLTPPLKPEQLAALLDQLEADGKSELRLAVGLVGLFGLRPAELAALRVEDKDGNLKLRVGQVKRNAKTMNQKKEERLVIPIDIDGRSGEAQRLLTGYHSKLMKLPPSILKQIELVDGKNKYQDVGHEFGQLLKRYKPWKSLVAANPGLTPYSLRHGYAWRAHMCSSIPLPPKMAAASMGHTVIVHQRNYGSWVDESSMERAFEMYQRGIAGTQDSTEDTSSTSTR